MIPQSHWVAMGSHSNSSAPVEQYLYLEEAIQHPVSNNCRALSHVNANECVLETEKGFRYNILKQSLQADTQ